jgi:hypothetical protein
MAIPKPTLLRKEDVRIKRYAYRRIDTFGFELLSRESSLDRKVSSSLPYRPQFILAGYVIRQQTSNFLFSVKKKLTF